MTSFLTRGRPGREGAGRGGSAQTPSAPAPVEAVSAGAAATGDIDRTKPHHRGSRLIHSKKATVQGTPPSQGVIRGGVMSVPASSWSS